MTFGGLEISFDTRVLRPREWTADQSLWAAELLADAEPGPVLEICAGAGHIGLLAVQGLDRHLVMVDLNPVACEFARINAAATDSSVEIREGRMDEVLAADESFALIIADPPWVPSDQTSVFPEDPLIAIDGGPAGLDIVWTCLDVIGAHLRPGGSALLQLGNKSQVASVEQHLADAAAPDLEVVDVRVHKGRGVVARIQHRG